MSNRTARAFNRSGATPAVAFDISKAFNRAWYAGLLHKLRSYGISCQIFGPISSLLSNTCLPMVLDGKSSQEYPVNAGVLQGPFLVLHFSYYTFTTLYSKYDQVSDKWQQLELASELESDLRGSVDWGRKWLLDFNAGKTQLV